MFARFEAHASPAAALMFTSGTTEGSAIGEPDGEPLYHASLGAEEYVSLLHHADFDVLKHVVEDPICRRTVWLARFSNEAGPVTKEPS